MSIFSIAFESALDVMRKSMTRDLPSLPVHVPRLALGAMILPLSREAAFERSMTHAVGIASNYEVLLGGVEELAKLGKNFSAVPLERLPRLKVQRGHR